MVNFMSCQSMPSDVIGQHTCFLKPGCFSWSWNWKNAGEAVAQKWGILYSIPLVTWYIWVEWSHAFMWISFGLDSKWFRLMYTLTLTRSSQLSILFPINTCYALPSHWYLEQNNLVCSFSKEMEGDRLGEGDILCTCWTSWCCSPSICSLYPLFQI